MRAWKLTMDTSSIEELIILLFKSWLIFLRRITKYDAFFVLQTFRENVRNDYVSPKPIYNNFVIIKNNRLYNAAWQFSWLWMSNKCVKFHVKIPSGC